MLAYIGTFYCDPLRPTFALLKRLKPKIILKHPSPITVLPTGREGGEIVVPNHQTINYHSRTLSLELPNSCDFCVYPVATLWQN